MNWCMLLLTVTFGTVLSNVTSRTKFQLSNLIVTNFFRVSGPKLQTMETSVSIWNEIQVLPFLLHCLNEKIRENRSLADVLDAMSEM